MKESFKKNRTGILLMLIAAILSCCGQLFWKIATEKGLVFLLLGFAFYAIGALVMLTAYKFGSLSVLQPMISLSYVLSIILAVIVLKEPITIMRIIGVLVITAGVILIGGGDD